MAKLISEILFRQTDDGKTLCADLTQWFGMTDARQQSSFILSTNAVFICWRPFPDTLENIFFQQMRLQQAILTRAVCCSYRAMRLQLGDMNFYSFLLTHLITHFPRGVRGWGNYRLLFLSASEQSEDDAGAAVRRPTGAAQLTGDQVKPALSESQFSAPSEGALAHGHGTE